MFLTPMDNEAELMDGRLLTLAAQVHREVEGLQTRLGEEQSVGLWELVKTFVHRGMEGVVCELADETGSMRSGMYHIDVRLSSEQVEDNVVRRAKHVIPFGPDEHRSGIRVGYDVWSRALSSVSPRRRQVVRSGLR